MAKKVILAVAGAGKTYHICHEIDPNKRNLILAFTHENINNIRNELCASYGYVPELTTIVTFDSFVYHQCVLPYEPSISKHFGNPNFVNRGICMMDPPPMRIYNKRGRAIPNPYYYKKNKLEHYITQNNQYYCKNLSELVMQVKKGRQSLIKRVAGRLNLFFDCVLIDEFQDFREYDYDLIVALAKQLNDVVLVGDFFQHSVSAVNNTGRPFKKNSVEVSFDEFVGNLKSDGFEVDTTTLDKSRRCSDDICEYVSRKLGIEIKSYGENEGSIKWINENAVSILEDQNIVKLVYREANKYSFNAINWSYSKGDTFDSTCVILTDKLEQFDDDNFSIKEISTVTRNMLYVAMTRSRGDLYLMKLSIFKKLKDKYISSK